MRIPAAVRIPAAARTPAALLGMSAYRIATGRRTAVVGPQEERLGGRPVWLLPNPSGLNASWQLPRLAAAYAELWQASDQ